MKKVALFILVALLVISPIFASDFFDVGLLIGQGNYKWPLDGISLTYGLSFGLTKKLEMDIWAVSEMIPTPFKSNVVVGELSWSLLGARNTGSKVSGVNVNTILSLGGFWRSDNNGGGIMLGITPISLGSPIMGKRERCLRTSLGWDFKNSNLVVLFSLMDVDIYLRGTYQDYL